VGAWTLFGAATGDFVWLTPASGWAVFGWLMLGRAAEAGLAGAGAGVAGAVAVVFFWSVGAAISTPLSATAKRALVHRIL
jgi:hypothetical protein